MLSKNERSNDGPKTRQEMAEDIKINKVGGLAQLEKYAGDALNLQGYRLTKTLDDILMVQYCDIADDGKSIQRGGIILPEAMTEGAWRVGEVIIAGPNANVNVGDFVIFPNDKGIRANNINGLRNLVFINEERIFGIAEKADK